MWVIQWLKKIWEYRFTPLCILTVISGILLLADLKDGYLWQDEAQKALISETILQHGVPKGTDGINSFSQEEGTDYGKNNLWRWHPWLPFYVNAASFALLGTSTFTARLPFALAGIASVILIYLLAYRLFRDKILAFITGLLLAFSVAFLLLTTQCGYYGLAIFLSISSIFGFWKILNQERKGFLIFTISTFLLFHTHYLYCASVFLTAIVYHLFIDRSQWRRTLIGIGVVSLVNIPAAIWYAGISKGYENLFGMTKSFNALQSYLLSLNNFVFPGFLWVILLILTFAGLAKFGKGNLSITKAKIGLPALFVLTTLTIIALLVHQPYFRYLGPIIPFIFLLVALLIRLASRFHWLVALGIMVIWLSTGYMKDYLYQLSHDYKGPMEGICQLLNQYAKSSDTVAIPYGDLPVKFYTDLKVIGGLSGKSYKSAQQADWIILRKNSIKEADAAMKKYVIDNLKRDQYKMTRINYPDIPYQNREVPGLHHFRTVKNAPRIRILKKKKR